MSVIVHNINMKKILFYTDPKGKCPFKDWYKTLDNNIKARIDARLVHVLEGNYGDHKRIDTNISELRLHFGAGYRIYYTEINNTLVILLSAGNKKTQQKDINKAKIFYNEMKGYEYE